MVRYDFPFTERTKDGTMPDTKHTDEDFRNPWDEQFSDNAFSFTGTVVEARFKVDPDYNANTVRLVLTLGDLDGVDQDTREEGYNVGSTDKFDAVEAGTQLEPVGKNKPSGRSGFKQFLDALLKAMPADARDELVSRGNPYTATIFEGLRIYFEERTEKIKFRDDEEAKEIRRMLPAGFEGYVDVAAGASTNGALSDEQLAELRSQLQSIAAESSTHQDFVTKALAIEGVTDIDPLVDEILDAGELGFFQQAKTGL